jgi:hypothetical protein
MSTVYEKWVSVFVYRLLSFFRYTNFDFIFQEKIVQKELEKRFEIRYLEQLRAILMARDWTWKNCSKIYMMMISVLRLNVVFLNSHLIRNKRFNKCRDAQKYPWHNQINQSFAKYGRIAHDLLPPVLDKFGLDAGRGALLWL